MRVIAVKTLKDWCESYPKARQSLLSWHEEVSSVDWESPHNLKSQFRSASIISNKRVIFNIHGNSFRLIVDIEYRLKIVFIVWFGTHKEYDKIDAKIIRYVKTDKN
ncbi:type II toxin-antitoxin system HigB family toxin [Algoriphagus persicinus]|uniref:type II toxin-antitoxin system HigB family toxin n=1 Tax=Algoriphagus persicinus TaxID=3108754 RepID=UPI002B3B8954|nr:type II toxin-antitoxin system HigB family toxin [Algoriphagus sp. E1-3-M2]MEB2783592.1 type II toxin-antitoxin system HigB family toxin [Algoriphagus sp. E1-3-M2]